MEKLNFLGIGPKIFKIAFSWLAASIVFTLLWKRIFIFSENDSKIIFYIGLALVIIGLIMYLVSAKLLLKGLKETKLVKKGTFYLCCNPLYTSILLFVIPGVSFMMNSWLVLTTSLVGYIVFKYYIKKEVVELEKFFGDDYKEYRAKTPDFFPFPVKKWF
jgi:protein-S-isoprenylcysteine O-methyltransferase Ste14